MSTAAAAIVPAVAADSHRMRWTGLSRLPIVLDDWCGFRLPYVKLDQSWTLDRFGSWTRGNLDSLLPRTTDESTR